MLLRLVLFFCLFHSLPALAAKEKNTWYKVESSSETEKKVNSSPSYPFDSVEKNNSKKHFKEVGYWSLQPKLGLGVGFFADKAVFNDNKTNRLLFSTSVYFMNQPWYRWKANVNFLQNSTLMWGAAWEFTPRRDPVRSYYGLGLVNRLEAQKQISNLVEISNYFLTVQYGWEFLEPSQYGWTVELKAFLSTDDRALQVKVAYIIPF